LTQTTLSALLVHISICCCLSAWAIEEIDRRRHAFLWTGTESVSGRRCKLAWPIVCAPKEHGGLGIPDLRVLGYALRLRWEWLRRTEPGSAWALLSSTPERKVSTMFSASVSVEIGDGSSVRFWTDAWLPEGAICVFAPNSFAAVGRRRLLRSVKDTLTDRRWVRDITGACTAPVLYEYLHPWERLMHVQLRPSEPDRFVWRWSADGQYSIRSAYQAFFTGWTTMAGAKELWRAAVSSKVKFFIWLALHGRLWTVASSLELSACCVISSMKQQITCSALVSTPARYGLGCCRPWVHRLHHLSRPPLCWIGGCTRGQRCRRH
jgi:hypothetical protein